MKVILSEEQIKRISTKMALSEDEVPVNTDDMVQKTRNTIRTANRNINNILSTTSGGYDNDEISVNTGETYVGSGTKNQTWLDKVDKTFRWYKTTFNNQYNQGAISGGNRADCSGFVCAALRNAGYRVGNYNTSLMVDDGGFTNAISGGFRRVEWNNTGYAARQRFPDGTILACRPGENNKRYGHTLILGSGKNTYDYGNNEHDKSKENGNLRHIYNTVWVPIA